MMAMHWIVAAALLGGAASRSTVEFTKDSLEVVRQNVLQKKAVLVDVRSLAEWNRGHIEGSILLPVDSLGKEVDPKMLAAKLPKDKILYTFCVVGVRAKTAAGVLQNHGYNVRALKPGYNELIKAGFKRAADKPAPANSATQHANTGQRNAG